MRFAEIDFFIRQLLLVQIVMLKKNFKSGQMNIELSIFAKDSMVFSVLESREYSVSGSPEIFRDFIL
jgi:hypothetical protein